MKGGIKALSAAEMQQTAATLLLLLEPSVAAAEVRLTSIRGRVVSSTQYTLELPWLGGEAERGVVNVGTFIQQGGGALIVGINNRRSFNSRGRSLN